MEHVLEAGNLLVADFPFSSVVHNILGVAHAELGNLETSIKHLKEAVKITPNYAEAYHNLGNSLRGVGQRSEAINSYKSALKFKPDLSQALNNLGQLHFELGDLDEAQSCLENAANASPTEAAAHHNLARICDFMSQYQEAAIHYRKAVELQAGSGDVQLLYSISQMPAEFVPSEIEQWLDEVGPNPGENIELSRSTLGLAKAMVLHNSGNHDAAWQHLVAANQFLDRRDGRRFQADMEINRTNLRNIRRHGEVVTPVETAGTDIPTSLFIVGPSRSGKTSVERLVAQLKEVKSGFENPVLDDALNETFKQAGIPVRNRTARLSGALNQQFVNRYLCELRQRANGAGVFTNTSPLNIKNALLAATLLPKAKFVFVKRDLDDITFRIFAKQYHGRNSYAYNVRKIREYVSWYYEMIDELSQKLAGMSLIVHYEAMVEEPDDTVHQVAQLCGLTVDTPNQVLIGDDRNCGAHYEQLINAELDKVDH